MITKFIGLALCIAALSSCSTAYKMGQTPDDVYYSPAPPAREQNDYLASERRPDRYSPNQGSSAGSNDEFDSYRNDRFLRMSIGSPLRLSAFDNYYGYDGFSNWRYNNYAYNFNTPWNGYYYWNSFYNPYSTFNYNYPYYGGYGSSYGYPAYGNVISTGTKPISSAPVIRPQAFNPGSYTNRSYSNSNMYLDRTNTVRPNTATSGGRYNNSNNTGTMRRAFSTTDNSYYNNSNNSGSSRYNNTYTAPRSESYTPSRSSQMDAPVRSYTPSSSPSSSGSSSSGSSGGGGGVSRPGRGGN